MFDEGRRRRERGQDVVVGAIQKQSSPELISLIQQFEIIPTRNIGGADVVDVEQLRIRQPEVCLIDGLAHDNPGGSKHAHRWEDVEELLCMGISVITTINLEFVGELQPKVSEIQQKTANTKVPMSFFYKAEEVVVVDAPANYHLQWSNHSHVNAPSASKERKLSQLRELALLLAADVVDKQLEAYLQRNGVSSSWGTQERFLVCLTAKSPALRMMSRAHLAQQRFHGILFALHVKTRYMEARDSTDLQEALRLAREVGAEVVELDGDDEVKTIIDFARRERITQLFLGHSRVPAWRWWFQGTTADRIIRAAEGIDVKLFPQ